MSTSAKRFNYPRLLFNGLILIALAFFTYQMFRITVQYFAFEDTVAFLKIKQAVVGIFHWKVGFYVHVFSSIFVLLAGFTQFSSYILQRYPKLHQWAGYAYVVIVVLISAPSGLVLGYYANGGLPAQVSFMMLAVLWMAFTSAALVQVLRKRMVSHGAFMIRSFALTSSAITLRLLKVGFAYAAMNGLIDAGPKEVYVTISWLGWVPNLIIAEMLIAGGLASRIMKRMKELKNQSAISGHST